ncbi:zinc finger protein [Venturia nashicola]|uniref:Zinc finger protein n=1 Tax=Venturia nashicola TaxID=86259 RepID=A0A4Z1NWX8_9PEZI|nr:zinc finger protein [Venturia nashicola]
MSGQSTHPFTCNTCQVAFKSSDLQRTHMQSDWHRYNLKRRVASLPPLSSEIFAEKVLANKASAAATAAKASYEKGCEICVKTYYSDNAYTNHLASSKHKQNMVKAGRRGLKVADDDSKSVMSSTYSLGEPMEKLSQADGIDEEAEEEFQEIVGHMKDASLEDGKPVSSRPTRPHVSAQGDRSERTLSPVATRTTVDYSAKRDPLKECLFCTQVFESLDTSVEHMSKTHSMFIPERAYLTDLEGLVKYLNEKVTEDYECLCCGRLKWSEDGIKTHMRDTNHCKIAYESEDQQLEIGQFYDFRSTYSDDEDWDSDEEMEDAKAPGGGVKLGSKRTAKVVGENGEELPAADGEDEGWESDDTDISSIPSEEIGRVYVDEHRDEVKERLKKNPHHAHGNTGRHRSADGFHSHAHPTPQAVYYDEYELHLPTGRVAGHRSMNKYYRQNLHNYPTPEEREQKLLTHGGSDDEADGSRPRGHDRGRQLATNRGANALGMAGVSDQKKGEIAAVEKREAKKARRDQAKFDARVGLKGNSQKHWRDHLLQ